MSTFLSIVATALGVYALNWQLGALSAVSNRQPIDLMFWKDAHPSEITLLTLAVLSFVLIALHITLYYHQAHRGNGRWSAWFPAALGKLQIPEKLAWLRVGAFILLVAVPTGIQCFWLGRLFDDSHLQIVWLPEYKQHLSEVDAVKKRNVELAAAADIAKKAGQPEPDEKPSSIPRYEKGLRGMGLLVWPAPRSDASTANWRWQYWYDNEVKNGRSDVYPQAFPGWQPLACVLAIVGLALSLLKLTWRAGFPKAQPC